MREVMASGRVSVDGVVGSPEEWTKVHSNALEELSDLPTERALQRAVPYLSQAIEDPTFLKTGILPVLGEARRAKDWYVAGRYDAPAGTFSLQIFVWPPETGTRIHDHSSWGAYRCIVGSVLEERYERLDNGSVHDYARLRKVWELSWGREDGVSTVLPGSGGIHRITNAGSEVAISVHLYGPRTGEVDGRDYDPSRDYVCDRRD